MRWKELTLRLGPFAVLALAAVLAFVGHAVFG